MVGDAVLEVWAPVEQLIQLDNQDFTSCLDVCIASQLVHLPRPNHIRRVDKVSDGGPMPISAGMQGEKERRAASGWGQAFAHAHLEEQLHSTLFVVHAQLG